MINTMFFGVNIILGMIIWKYVLKPTILDHFMDKLFDIREGVRDYYVSSGIPLDHVTYKNLRDLINGHLRFTEHASFSMVCYYSEVVKKKKLDKAIGRSLDKKFKTGNKELAAFIKETRQEAAMVLLDYMVLSSFFAVLLVLGIAVVIVPVLLFRKMFDGLKYAFRVDDYIDYAFRKSLSFVSKKASSGKVIEGLSYEEAFRAHKLAAVVVHV